MSDDGDMDYVGPLGIDRLLGVTAAELPFPPVFTTLVATALEPWTGWACVWKTWEMVPQMFS
jgi:hypothetical protein